VTRQPDYEPDPRYERDRRGGRDSGYDQPNDDGYLDESAVRARYLDPRGAAYDDPAATYDDRAAPYDDRAAPYDDRAAPYDDRAGRRRSRGYEDEVEQGGLSPFRIVLAIAAVGAIVFLGFAVLARDIPMLASATLVFGVVFVALAVTAGRATWRAATDGRNGRAFGLAVGGGVAAMMGLGALALAIVLILVWGRG
jgi:hypothetical protein